MKHRPYTAADEKERMVESSNSTLLRIILPICLLGGLAARAGISLPENPYQTIARRNVFGLRPPTPAPKVEPPSTPLPTVVLTGITTMLGEKQAFLEITPLARTPQPTKAQACMLAEGQREGDVQVIQIDPKAESVKISNTGIAMTLTFEKNGRKPTTTPVAPSRQVVPSLPIRRLPFHVTGQPWK